MPPIQTTHHLPAIPMTLPSLNPMTPHRPATQTMHRPLSRMMRQRRAILMTRLPPTRMTHRLLVTPTMLRRLRGNVPGLERRVPQR